MNAHDRAGFAELLVGVGEVFGESISDARMELYFAALADLELAEIRAALSAHVQSSKFFPRPAEIREAILGSVEDAAVLAWGGLLKMVRRCGWAWNAELQGPLPWPDEPTKRAALELYGGWRALCESLPSEGAGLAVAAKHFQATYAAYARQDLAALPPGETGRELSPDEARKALSDLMQRPENVALLAAGRGKR